MYLFLCTAVRQYYGRKRRYLEFGLYRWATSGVCWVLGGRIVSNARIRELCGVTKEVEESIDEDVLRRFGHVARMEDRFAKGLCRSVCWYSIRAVEMDIIRGLLGIRRMDIVPNVRVRELWGVTK